MLIDYNANHTALGISDIAATSFLRDFFDHTQIKWAKSLPLRSKYRVFGQGCKSKLKVHQAKHPRGCVVDECVWTDAIKFYINGLVRL